MDKNEFQRRFKERRKRCLTSRLRMNLLLLLPPSLALSALLVFSFNVFFVSLILIYLILPMFYTVLYRMKYDVSGIGDPDFSYGDGYKAFFTGSMSGVFGMLGTVFSTLALILLFYMIFSPLALPLANAYGVQEAYKTFLDAFSSTAITSSDLMTKVTETMPLLSRLFTAFVGIVLFFPIFYALFYSVNTNLDSHYLSTIVLPDIDKNVTAGQARTLSKGSFGRLYQGYRLLKSLKQNWPYYLAFTVIYAGAVYGMSMVRTDNLYLVFPLTLIGPSASVFVGLFLNYFCLMHDAITMEESQDYIRSLLPKPMQVSVYQTYINPNYVHGEESAIRGSFIPAPKESDYRQEDPFSTTNDTDYSASEQPQPPQEDPIGNVVDLSQSVPHQDGDDKK